MKYISLSADTIKVLKNYSIINQSIKVSPGNVLRTLSNSNIILSKAKVTEEFEVPWAIYNLPEFLSALELFDNPILEFKEKMMNIKEESDSKKCIVYRYADPAIVHSTDKEVTMPQTEVNFNLTEEDLLRCLKTAAVLQSPHFVITNSETADKVQLSIMDCDNPAANVYSMDIEAVYVFHVKALTQCCGAMRVAVRCGMLRVAAVFLQ